MSQQQREALTKYLEKRKTLEEILFKEWIVKSYKELARRIEKELDLLARRISDLDITEEKDDIHYWTNDQIEDFIFYADRFYELKHEHED